MDKQNDVWKDKGTVSVQIGNGKVDFSRTTLKKYFISHHRFEINRETFLDYFNKDSLSKMDEETGCYLPHLLFLDGSYHYDNIMSFIFDYVSPYEFNKDGQLYLDCVFQSHMRISSMYYNYSKILDDAVKLYNINVNEQFDNQGNNLLHWIITGEAIEHIETLTPYFFRYLFFEPNNFGVSPDTLNDLAISLNRYIPRFQYEMFGDSISLTYNFENYSSSTNYYPIYVYSNEDKVMKKFMNNSHWRRVYENLNLNNCKFKK